MSSFCVSPTRANHNKNVIKKNNASLSSGGLQNAHGYTFSFWKCHLDIAENLLFEQTSFFRELW